MLGGGEHAFVDLLTRLPNHWDLTAVVPGSGELANRLKQNGIGTRMMPLPPVRPWRIHEILRGLKTYVGALRRLQPDVIYANGSRAAPYGGLAGNILGIDVLDHIIVCDNDFLSMKAKNLI